MKKTIILILAIILLAFPLLLVTADSQSEKTQSSQAIQFEDTNWILYKNAQEGYYLLLPPQLQANFKKRNEMQWAVENRMPFDYVNFGAKDTSGNLVPFELGVGAHWNKDGLGTREFADKKDEGLKMSGSQIVTIRQTDFTVAGIKGVRDDFRIQQPYGWRSYSRIIIPYKDKFFVFLGTLGNNRSIPGYEDIFQKIVESFELEGP